MPGLSAVTATTAPAPRPPRRHTGRRLPIEDIAVMGACLLVAVLVNRHLLRPDVVEGDATVHLAWMWHWRDAGLFDDGLTASLRESARYPLGYQALFWLPAHVVDPIAFGEWVGVALMAGSGWLVFKVTRLQAPWRPAAWLATALFLALFDIHRFSGGFPRAFVQPVVLATVLLLLQERRAWAAVVAGAGALLYPPAAVLAVGTRVRRDALDGWRPGLHATRARWAVCGFGLTVVAVLGPRLLTGTAPDVLTAAQAHAYPEFGPSGTLRFFATGPLEYLRQNRSGFDLRTSGSIVAVAALALLLVRPANGRLLRQPVVAMGVASLVAFAAAQLVLFRLYLPHRYTYPLVALGPIVIATVLEPTWAAVQARPRTALRGWALLCAPLAIVAVALVAFPVGPLEPVRLLFSVGNGAAAGAALGLAAILVAIVSRRAIATRANVLALVFGTALVTLLLVVPDHGTRGWTCSQTPVVRFLSELPKDAIVAGDPIDLNCLPASARRSVVISTQLAPAYETAYLRAGRARMFATLRAMYGPSRQAIVDLRARYGATHLWIRRAAIRRERPDRGRWRGRGQPYSGYVRRLLRGGATPAVLRLPAACRRFKRRQDEVYDLACVAASGRSSSSSSGATAGTSD